MLWRLKAQDELTIKNDSGNSNVFHPEYWLVQVLCAVSHPFAFSNQLLVHFLYTRVLTATHLGWARLLEGPDPFHTHLQQTAIASSEMVLFCNPASTGWAPVSSGLFVWLITLHAPGSLSSNFWEIQSWCSVTMRTQYQPTVLKVCLWSLSYTSLPHPNPFRPLQPEKIWRHGRQGRVASPHHLVLPTRMSSGQTRSLCWRYVISIIWPHPATWLSFFHNRASI